MGSLRESRIVAVLLLAGAGLVVTVLFVLSSPETANIETVIPPERPAVAAQPEAKPAEPAPQLDVEPVDALKKREDDPEVDEGTHLFEGIVLSAATYDPVPRFRVTLYRGEEQDGRTEFFPHGASERIDGESGCFALVRPVPAERTLFQVRVKVAGYHRGVSEPLVAPHCGSTRNIRFVLDLLPAIEGRVTDALTGQPIEGAAAFSATDAGAEEGAVTDLDGVRSAPTDETGRFRLRVDAGGGHTLVVRHPAYRDAVLLSVPYDEYREIALHRGFCISGTAVDPESTAFESGAVIVAGTQAEGFPRAVQRIGVKKDGSFESAPLPAGLYTVRFEEVGYGPLSTRSFGWRIVKILDRDIAGLEAGAAGDCGSLEGTLLEGEEPVRGAAVSLRLTRDERFLDQTYCYISGPDSGDDWAPPVATDIHGGFAFHGLPPGDYSLEIDVNGYTMKVREIRIESSHTTSRTVRLAEGTVLYRLVDARSGRPIERKGSFCETLFGRIPVSRGGIFEIPFLPKREIKIQCSADGYAFTEAVVTSTGAGRSNHEIPMEPAGSALVEVLSNRPFESSDVTFSVSPFYEKHWYLSLSGRELKRDRAGRYRIDRFGPGPYTLTCRLFDEEVTAGFDIVHGRTAEVCVSFSFEKPFRVLGTLFAGREPVPLRRVTFRDRDRYFDRSFSRTEFSTRTDESGSFEIELPRPGMYQVFAEGPDESSIPLLGENEVWVWEEDTRLDLETGTRTIEGRLVCADTDAPVTEASVSTTGCHTVPDSQGRFIFFNAADEAAKISVTAMGYISYTELDLEPDDSGDREPLVIRVGEGCGSLRIRFERPLREFSLSEQWESVRFQSRTRIIFRNLRLGDLIREDDQTWLAHGVPPGRSTIVLCDTLGRLFQPKSKTVEVKEGEVSEVLFEVK